MVNVSEPVRKWSEEFQIELKAKQRDALESFSRGEDVFEFVVLLIWNGNFIIYSLAPRIYRYIDRTVRLRNFGDIATNFTAEGQVFRCIEMGVGAALIGSALTDVEPPKNK